MRFGGFLANVDVFDAGLFAITGAEADLMDPQQRQLLEVSWEALQTYNKYDTACSPDTGVYVGIQQMEYGSLATAHGAALGAFSGAVAAAGC